MNENDPLPISSPTLKKETLTLIDSTTFSKPRYKFWLLTAIILLAFWSMLTGTVTLRFSGNLIEDTAAGFTTRNDLDVLEMEDREKVVEHMWDVYTNSRGNELSRFWRDAFVAAYEDLVSDVMEVRRDAVLEIAKMSVGFVDVNPPPSELMNLRELHSHGSRL